MPRTTFIPAQQLHHLPPSPVHPADTYFHFSFAHYFDPNNMNFGVLRVLNDDEVRPHDGFDEHGHRDVEIVTYVIAGELTHWDSVTRKKETLQRGEVQTIGAGTGLTHSEKNEGDTPCRLLQIWFPPQARGLSRRYASHAYRADERQNRLLHIVGSDANAAKAPLSVRQDVNLYVSELTTPAAEVRFELAPGRQIYLANLEGEVTVAGLAPGATTTLSLRDALKIEGEAALRFDSAKAQAHFLLIEMAASGIG